MKTYSKVTNSMDETFSSLSETTSTEVRNTVLPSVHTKPYNGCKATQQGRHFMHLFKIKKLKAETTVHNF